MHGDDTGDGHALLLPAGQTVGGLFAVFQHSHGFEALFYALPDFLCGNTHIFGAEADVLFNNLADDLVVRILKDHAGCLADVPEQRLILCVQAVHPDCSLCGKQKRVDVLCQSGFSRSVVAENGDKLAGLDIQRDIIDSPDGTGRISLFIALYIIMNQFADLYHGLPISLAACPGILYSLPQKRT